MDVRWALTRLCTSSEATAQQVPKGTWWTAGGVHGWMALGQRDSVDDMGCAWVDGDFPS